MKIKVVVPVATEVWNEPIREAYEEYKSPETEIDIENLEKGPESIESNYDECWAGLPTLLKCEEAEKEGYDAVIDYCFGDPALSAIKEALDIPVVGINESSVHMASTLAKKFSVIGVGPQLEMEALTEENELVYGLDHKFTSLRSTDIAVLDIHEDFDKLYQALLEEGKKAIEEDGAQAIVLGCGSLLELADKLEQELEVPVIDSGLAALKWAESLVKLGLSQSRLAYPSPTEKKRIE